MKIGIWGPASMLLALLPAAHAQFALSVMDGGTATPVPALYNFGTAPSGVSVTVQFQIVNTSTAPADLTVLSVAGDGFTLSGGPTLPVTLQPQSSVNFTVTFEGCNAGSYDAPLEADGLTVYLTATVTAALAYQVQQAGGEQNLGTSPINFGSVQVGQTEALQFIANNCTGEVLVVPPVSVSPGDFSLSGAAPSGTTLQGGQQAEFEVQFQPSAAGTRTGTLRIGSSSFSLTGAGVGSVPAPQIAITLANSGAPTSGEQGSITVNFASPASAAGSGTLTLQFQPSVAGASDPAIAFASGGQSAPFTFAAGDVQATFSSGPSVAFQTGTTAGTIAFTLTLENGATEEVSLTIPPSPVILDSESAVRELGSIQVSLSGFDNTYSASQLAFTFYDINGNALPQGAIDVNAASDFQNYFSSGQAGGAFSLLATFQVTGNTDEIGYVTAQITNSLGVTAAQQIQILN